MPISRSARYLWFEVRVAGVDTYGSHDMLYRVWLLAAAAFAYHGIVSISQTPRHVALSYLTRYHRFTPGTFKDDVLTVSLGLHVQ